jgi:hypothetical protein
MVGDAPSTREGGHRGWVPLGTVGCSLPNVGSQARLSAQRPPPVRRPQLPVTPDRFQGRALTKDSARTKSPALRNHLQDM